MIMTDGRGHHRNRKANWNLTAKAKLTLKDQRQLCRNSTPEGSFTKHIVLKADPCASGAPRNWCRKKCHHPSALTYMNSSLGNFFGAQRIFCLYELYRSRRYSKMPSLLSSNPSALYCVLGATQDCKRKHLRMRNMDWPEWNGPANLPCTAPHHSSSLG